MSTHRFRKYFASPSRRQCIATTRSWPAVADLCPPHAIRLCAHGPIYGGARSPPGCERTYGRWWDQCPSALEPIGSPPDGYSSKDYVDIYFDTPVVPTKLQIFETFNPGSIVRIVACYRTQPVNGPINIPPYPTDLIRLEIDGGRCSYFPQFDAVLLTGFAQVHPSGWPGYSQLEADSTGLNDDASPNFPQGFPNTPCSEVRPGPALSFFSDLLRPRTPHLCLPDATAGETRSLSMSSLSPIPSPDASPTRLPSNWVWLLTQLQRHSCANEPRGLSGQLAVPSTLFRLPPVGWNVLCEILLHIFSYLDLRTLCRTARVSRQFRCLAYDALARIRNLNLQAYWPWLSDTGLLSLGKRLGCVNLAARAAAAISSGNSIAPFSLLRRQREENGTLVDEDDLNLLHSPNSTGPIHEKSPRKSRPRTLAARVRSVSLRAQAAAVAALTEQNRNSDVEEIANESAEPGSASPKLPRLSREWLDAFHSAFAVCRLRRLDMSWCGNYSQISPTAFGHFLGDCCRQLLTLRLSSCKFLNDDCVLHIVNTCSQLRELDLSSCTGISAHGFLTLGRLIHLRWLSLYRTRVTDAGLLSLAGLCQHLKHLDLGACSDVQDMDTVLDQLTQNNTGIRSINLWRCVTLSAAGVDHLTRSCRELEELDLGWCRNVTITPEANCVVRLIQHCRQIRKLFLSGTSLLSADDLLLVAQYLGPNIEQLDIQGSISITTASVATLLGQCPHLRLLDVSFCANVPLHSLVQLRQLFPNCTIISSVRDLNADEVGHPIHQVLVDELLDDLDNPAEQLFGLRELWPPALLGSPELLALPAPNRLAAIAGPSAVSSVD
ncbi:F-box/LRR-repeat protein 4 [Fasciola gigantica]|uniref:F-box/LRR-repeat protein 4 n=1 Tax=Fasciola gigantica TaxID=46835 RepID=A0A504Z4N5_FASGI|nr:F-box/LRR-repeat protein 4 [Fasciola gigantica]